VATSSREKRALVVDAALVAGLHAVACVIARLAGFDHVSDDDFARVTIAQELVHAPKLDPSGTSWLPFPFWILGAALAVLGRSLAVARGVSIALASLAAAAPYVALRLAGSARRDALVASALAFGTPWAIWLGAATVPESFTASLTAAAAIGGAVVASRGKVRSAILFALAMLAACLSRYEPWPVAAVLAGAALLAARRAWRADAGSVCRACLVAAALCMAGPLAWMAWNAHAHDGPLHFFRRVSGFKRAIGEGSTDLLDALLLYPRLLLTTRPEIALPAVALLPVALRDPVLRRRWALPLGCVAAQIAFLAYGNARDGAPAHHPERALLGALVIAALFVGDVVLTALRTPSLVGGGHGPKVLAGAIGLAWIVSFGRGLDMPGRSRAEDRSRQIAEGERLRREGVSSLVITPCAFEHFALLAAFGAPEKARIEPRTGPPPAPDEACPRVIAED
jgi:hypothetical protein